jgi:hypothetical protein
MVFIVHVLTICTCTPTQRSYYNQDVSEASLGSVSLHLEGRFKETFGRAEQITVRQRRALTYMQCGSTFWLRDAVLFLDFVICIDIARGRGTFP